MMSAEPGTGAYIRLAAAAVLGAGVLTASYVISRHDGDSVDVAAGPAVDAKTSAECRRLYADLNPELVGEPVQRLLVRHNAQQLRVYVSETDNRIGSCQSGQDGVEQTFTTVMDNGPANRIQFFGEWDAVAKANLLLGRVPTGTTTIKAHLASGQTVTGTHDGDIFVVWMPNHSVASAQITALGPDGSAIATAIAPDGS
jgi:hypothetical protein